MKRRQFLVGSIKGVTVYLALPTLTSLLPKTAWGVAENVPMNLITLYMPDGTYPHSTANGQVSYNNSMEKWYPNVGSIANLNQLPTMLKPLEANKQDFSIVSGLQSNYGNLCAGQHADAIAKYLTSNSFPPSNCGNLNSSSDSVDQAIGKAIAKSTDPSLVQKVSLNAKMVNRAYADVGTGADNRWGHNISYINGLPAFGFTSPKQMFDSVFGGLNLPPEAPENLKRKSLLDFLIPSIKSAESKASNSDKQVLQRWLAGYEELKKNIDEIGNNQPTCQKPNTPDANWNLQNYSNRHTHYDQRLKAYLDIFLAAIECKARHTCTLLFDGESAEDTRYGNIIPANMYYSESGQTPSSSDMNAGQHIGFAHYQSGGIPFQKYLRLTTLTHYRMNAFKYLLDETKKRNLFDKTLITIGHGFRDGNHSDAPHDFPLIVGGNGGGFKTGQHFRLSNVAPGQVRYGNQNQFTKLSDFWESVKRVYGISQGTSRTNALFG